jgi:hypothetical protein
MKKSNLLTNDKLKWIGVDLDGVLAKSIWPKEGIGPMIKGARGFCQKLVKDSWKIIIYTSRHWADYELIEKWCQKNKIPVRRIICGKPLFRCIIDDRCMEFTGDFNELYRRIGGSKTARPSRFLARQR